MRYFYPHMEIIKAEYVISSPSIDLCPAADKAEFAFIGRSNVGKSSLINMLCKYQGLAKTSAAPGKTQMINHFIITSRSSIKSRSTDQWYLVDLPGYGYAKVSQKNRAVWQKMIADYLRKRKSLANVFVLIDGRHEPQKIDLEFVNQLGEWQIPFAIAFTKADKMKPGGLKRNVDLFREALRKDWEIIPTFFVTSAEKADGRKEMLNYLDEVLHPAEEELL